MIAGCAIIEAIGHLKTRAIATSLAADCLRAAACPGAASGLLVRSVDTLTGP